VPCDFRERYPHRAAVRLSRELRRDFVVIEVGSETLRYGLAGWREPRTLPLAFDPVRGTLEVAGAGDHDLPPPPLVRLRMLFGDASVLRRLADAACRALGAPGCVKINHRVGWTRDILKMLNLGRVATDSAHSWTKRIFSVSQQRQNASTWPAKEAALDL